MLHALELENFKAFGERQRIELAPITLIFGANSAGKSSILQSLLLLKQSVPKSTEEDGPLLRTRGDAALVDLGGFADLIYDHDLKRELKVRLCFDPERGPYNFAYAAERKVEPFAVELSFSRPTFRDDVALRSFRVHAANEDDCILEVRYFNSIAGSCTRLTKSLKRWKPFFDNFFKQPHGDLEADVSSELTALKQEHAECVSNLARWRDPSYDQFSGSDLQGMIVEEDRSRLKLAEEMSSLEPLNRLLRKLDGPPSLEEFIEVFVKLQRGIGVIRNGFLPTLSATSRGMVDSVIGRLGLTDKILDCTIMAGQTANIVGSTLARLSPIGPYRQPPLRFYEFSGTTPNSVGYSGEWFPDLLFRSEDSLDLVNIWLENLNIGYRLQVDPIGDKARDLYEVRLVDYVEISSTSDFLMLALA